MLCNCALCLCSFVKVSLTKNPKKRPSAERMLYQPFVLAGDLNIRLSLELLNKVRNPEAASASASSSASSVSASSASQVYNPGAASASAVAASVASANIDDDEGGLAQNVPLRIASRSSHRNKEKTNSKINSKNFPFLPPTHLHFEPGKLFNLAIFFRALSSNAMQVPFFGG